MDKSKTNSKSKLKEHRLSSNNLDKALHDAYLLNTLLNQTNEKDKQTKSYKIMKHVHFSPVIFVKLVIPAGTKDRNFKTRMVKSLVHSGASESIITKSKANKRPVNKTKPKRQWLTAPGFITTNTKTATSFSFPELHANNYSINHYV